MTLQTDNLTEQELAHMARLANSPIEQQKAFREALMSLLRCFGDGAEASAVVVYLDHVSNETSIFEVNIDLATALSALEAGTAHVRGQLAKMGVQVQEQPHSVQ